MRVPAVPREMVHIKFLIFYLNLFFLKNFRLVCVDMSIYINFFCINFNQVFYPKDNIGFPLIFIKHLGFVSDRL